MTRHFPLLCQYYIQLLVTAKLTDISNVHKSPGGLGKITVIQKRENDIVPSVSDRADYDQM